ncbi:MAG: S1-like domain-containing RNA-binding protein [bacterium]|jgi:predicted RNA-binding protein (virulence factor B family)
MADVGKYNRLEVRREAEQGFYLAGEGENDILLPRQYAPDGLQAGDDIEVFIYRDSEDRIIATTLKPKACINEFAFLTVAAVTSVGAFLDWGLPKDLLVPFREQVVRMQKGRSYVVYLYLDEATDRIVASAKVNKFLSPAQQDLKNGDEVQIMIYRKTDLGYKVIVNDRFSGMIFDNEIFVPVKTGQRLQAYIKQVREDGKLDIALQKPGISTRDKVTEQILAYLKDNDGVMTLTDKSPAELIYTTFGISKRAFKQAIGKLYKEKIIEIEPDRVKLTQ